MPKIAHKKQHDLRGSMLARLADDCKERVAEIHLNRETYATERIQTLEDLERIFRKAAKRESKLR